MKTIYEARDRQGTKLFAERPEFLSGHDIFVGARCEKLPKRVRLVRNFTAKVTGEMRNRYPKQYPATLRVGKPPRP